MSDETNKGRFGRRHRVLKTKTRLSRRRHLFERLEDRLLLAADASFSAYDMLGNVVLVRDAQGAQTSVEHDALGRVTSIQGPSEQEYVRLAYDPNGNIIQMEDATGHTFYAYDAFDRITAVTRSVDAIFGNGDDSQVGYSYDTDGNLDRLTYPDGTLVDHDYDAANRLTRVAQGDDVTAYTYFPDGQLATATLPNAVRATYDYDAAGRLHDLVYRNGSNHLVSSFHYTFDANSNRTSMEVRRPNLETPDPQDFLSGLYQYAYDVRSQLIDARYPDGVVVTYAYDGAGNRTTMTTDPDGTGPQPAQVLNYHYGVENRLTHTTGAGGAVVTQYEYDASGNRIAETAGGQTTTYAYDYRNLLVQVTKGATLIRYDYDGRGDRVARIENGVRTQYVNDVNRLHTQVLADMDGAGTINGRYVYGVGRISGLLVGEPTPMYYLSDTLGSTTELTSDAGTGRASYSYDAFGMMRATIPEGGTSQLAHPFFFAGENVDEDTSLVYLRARYYDPAAGQFLTRDPIGFYDGPNRYVYAGNNPANNIDPSGQFIQIAALVIVGAGMINGGVAAVGSAWNGDDWRTVLNEGAKGTLQGASAATVGLGLGFLTKNPWITAAYTSTTSELVGEYIDRQQGKGFDPSLGNIAGGTLLGGVTGPLADDLFRVGRGRPASLTKLRSAVDLGPNTIGVLNREAVGIAVGVMTDPVATAIFRPGIAGGGPDGMATSP